MGEITNWHEDVLNEKQKVILQKLSFTKPGFYLAGGTALALQIGHRKSIDFDFFCSDKFNSEALRITLTEELKDFEVTFLQVTPSTINMLVDEVKMSFFYYPYPPLEQLIETSFVKMVGLLDIACMKCSAITSRSVKKDYIDLYFLLQKFSLQEVLAKCQLKFPGLDKNVILKSLVYFDEMIDEDVVMLDSQGVNMLDIKNFLIKQARSYVPQSHGISRV